ncbi:sulfite exporter TauE/SafE family protein [Crateriforma conspicua]|uniref:Probable membrane transporter protein n=1 Tax=Crateriforma conspicua TaxID=2527996 RepID=A0A5C5Y740_9PLAN|nr:sulfite exporter TauE/SafE family protein [Crateriforma conspicua]TWT71487.1 Sulfite exporter TauE/SafE [Crateriforma conspicua]
MNEILPWVFLVLCTLIASTLSAVTGFGGAAILLPVLVAMFGIRDAVPILTVAQLIGNGSRVWFNRKEIRYDVVGWFALGAVPAALIGGWLFAAAPAPALTRLLGVFLIAVVIFRHTSAIVKMPTMQLRWFAPLGAVTGFLSALIGTVGPLVAPFFLAFGLIKGAYIGTEALAAIVMHTTKLAAYGGGDAFSTLAAFIGLLLGPILILGSLLGKRLVDRVSERFFSLLIEGVLVVVGLIFLAGW